CRACLFCVPAVCRRIAVGNYPRAVLMRVLLFSNDLMPFGTLPTSGGGLRAWQLYQGLQLHGIQVVASMPKFPFLAQKNYCQIPEAQREVLWDLGGQDEVYRRVKPDAVLYTSNWDHYDLTSRPNVPLIIDLHGPRYLETKMWERTISTERKVKVF